MLEYLDFAAFTERDNGKKWEHKLYEPSKLADSFNLIAYFIASDEVNIEELQNYREATKTELYRTGSFVVGLSNHNDRSP